ncbi:hypothetical protein NA57DRAFT_76314 [Rhizodiscina lignyota]|uniref:Uncharacterized protein n=1 Tax=Rhizodiscina lignyota TaxID=1504668 RepID=A0A9P4ICL2_9PEZI|nr:hypothetical protein NA57DRAFT_76314 [Rhizodiscina lignyota]
MASDMLARLNEKEAQAKALRAQVNENLSPRQRHIIRTRMRIETLETVIEREQFYSQLFEAYGAYLKSEPRDLAGGGQWIPEGDPLDEYNKLKTILTSLDPRYVKEVESRQANERKLLDQLQEDNKAGNTTSTSSD